MTWKLGYFFILLNRDWRLFRFYEQGSLSCKDEGGLLAEEDVINSGDREKTDNVSVSRGTCLWKQEGPAQSEQADLGRKALGPDTDGLRLGNMGGKTEINDSKAGPGFALSLCWLGW